MKTNNLLASVALFSELYNSAHYENVTDILAEFIKALVVSESKWSTTPGEVGELLESIYGFNIPNSVIKSTMKNRLDGIAQNINGVFHFDKTQLKSLARINTEYEQLKENQQQITSNLFEFVNFNNHEELSAKEKSQIESDFQKFLMDSGTQEKYTEKISAFVIKNSKEAHFTKSLNLIREGIVLYQGIKYSSDLNIAKVWNTDLVIYLSPEHLLSAVGYNGIVFKELFEDFFNLVKEINLSNRNRGSDKKISLKFFPEAQEEIDALFQMAERIVAGKVKLMNRRTAVKEIIADCKTESQVIRKKVAFYQDLRGMGILFHDLPSGELYKYADYNVEDLAVLEFVRKQSLEKVGAFDEDEAHRLFRIFTRVNYYRGGTSRDKFENIGSIYITNNGLGLYLAHNNAVKFEEGDIPFAKDLDYITNKLWFKLRKGLGGNDDFPRSFDVVTKAQIVLSSHIQNSIIKNYEQLKIELREQRISEESAQEINYTLRVRSTKPEDITDQNVEDSLAFLEAENLFEEIVSEKQKQAQLFNSTQERVKELEYQLAERDEKDRLEELERNNLELERQANEFSRVEWQNESNTQMMNLVRFMFIFFLTVASIVVALFLKVFSSFTIPINQWDTSIYFFWVAVILIVSLELFGRSYLFNKERIKLGWIWFSYLFRRRKYHEYKANKLAEFRSNYYNSNDKVE